MKQTNNALTFLLAQYRAIFKRASLNNVLLPFLLVGCGVGLMGSALAQDIDATGKDVTISDRTGLEDDYGSGVASNITIGSGHSVTFALAGDVAAEKRGVYHLSSGTIDVQGGAADGSLVVGDTSSDTGSILVLDSAVKLISSVKPTTGIGLISVEGGSADFDLTTSQLELSDSHLLSFLGGSTVTGSSSSSSYAGAIKLSEGRLVIDSAKTIELSASSFGLAGDVLNLSLVSTTASAGQIELAGYGIFKANKLSVAAPLSDTAAAQNLSLEAGDLSLGSSSLSSADSESLVFSGAEVSKSLSFKTKEGSFVLGRTIKLNGDTKEGSIKGAVALSGNKGTLKVEQGLWRASDELTLIDGSLFIRPTQKSDIALSLNKLSLAKHNNVAPGFNPTISVDGLTNINATLDLSSNSNVLNVLDKSSEGVLSVQGSGSFLAPDSKGCGILRVNADDFFHESEGLLASKYALSISAGGKLEVVGDVSNADAANLDAASAALSGSSSASSSSLAGLAANNGSSAYLSSTANLSSQAGSYASYADASLTLALNKLVDSSMGGGTVDAGVINFDSGWLDVKGSLTLEAKSASDKLDIGSSMISAERIDLVAFSGHDFEIESGFLQVSSSLSSNGTIKLTDSDAALIFNGSGGEIDAKIVANMASANRNGTINFNSGSWVAWDDLELAGKATMNIGSDEGAASLSVAGKLSLEGQDNMVKVTSGSSINLGAISLGQGATLALNGSTATIKGDASLADSPSSSIAGVSLHDGSMLVVNNGSVLTFAEGVVERAISYDDSTRALRVDSALKSILASDGSSEVRLEGTLKDGSGTALTLTKDNVSQLINGISAMPSEFKGVINVGSNELDLEWTEGTSDKEITWDKLSDFASLSISGSVTSNKLKEAVVTNIDTSDGTADAVRGHVGALKANDDSALDRAIEANGNLGLYAAQGVGADGAKYYAYTYDTTKKAYEVLGLKSTAGDVILANGGQIAGVTIIGDGDLYIKDGHTEILGLAYLKNGDLVLADNTTLTVRENEDGDAAQVGGKLIIKPGASADFKGTVSLTEGGVIQGTVTALDEQRDITLAEGAELTIAGGSLIAESLVMESSYMGSFSPSVLMVGRDGSWANSASIANNGNQGNGALTNNGSADAANNSLASSSENELFDSAASYGGTLLINNLTLKGGVIYSDPDYGQEASLSFISKLTTVNGNDHVLDGALIGGKNSIYAIGFDFYGGGANAGANASAASNGAASGDPYQAALAALDTISFLLDSNKSLSASQYGAVLLIDGNSGISIDVDSASTNQRNQGISLFADSLEDFVAYYNANNGAQADIAVGTTDAQTLKNLASTLQHQVYLGEHTAVVATDKAAQAAKVVAGQTATPLISFFDSDTATSPNDQGIIIADGGAVILTGEVNVGEQYQVFSGGALKFINGAAYDPNNKDKALKIQTTNGLLVSTIAADGLGELKISDNARSLLQGASEPVFNTIMDYLNRSDQSKVNDALSKISRNTNGLDGDRIVRAPAFAGIAQATLAAQNVVTKAMEQRALATLMNSGARADLKSTSAGLNKASGELEGTSSGLTNGNNGLDRADGVQGQSVAQSPAHNLSQSLGEGQKPAQNLSQARVQAEGQNIAQSYSQKQGQNQSYSYNTSALLVSESNGELFVSPVYVNSDSEGLGAQGINYGVELDLRGASLGVDYKVEHNLHVGGVLSIGEGDSEGKSSASGTSNDFKYVGVGAFVGWSRDSFSLMADLSYTKLSHDLKVVGESFSKQDLSLDSASLSLGLSAAYSFEYEGVGIVPHAGLRYSNIKHDDYKLEGIGEYQGERLSIVSIPVGVTVATAFAQNEWLIKPTLDLSLIANLGDDELEGNFKWAEVDLNTQVASKVMDGWCYGATAAVEIGKGAFAAQVGLSYTGSSSTDTLGVNATAMWRF